MKSNFFLVFIVAVCCCCCQKQNGEDAADTSADLPEGWENAQPVDHFISQWTDEYPFEPDASVEIGVSERDSGLSVAVANVPFWWTEYYQTFLNQKKDNVYELLIQPTDMSADANVPIGNGGYEPWSNYRVLIDGGKSVDVVRIYRRESRFYEEDPIPKLLGEASAIEYGDCIILDACVDSGDCVPDPEVGGGNPELGEYFDCFPIESCNGHFCAWNTENEWIGVNL